MENLINGGIFVLSSYICFYRLFFGHTFWQSNISFLLEWVVIEKYPFLLIDKSNFLVIPNLHSALFYFSLVNIGRQIIGGDNSASLAIIFSTFVPVTFFLSYYKLNSDLWIYNFIRSATRTSFIIFVLSPKKRTIKTRLFFQWVLIDCISEGFLSNSFKGTLIKCLICWFYIVNTNNDLVSTKT